MSDKSFQQEFLNSHNAYRAAHRAAAMTLSGELTASAQRWADHLLALGQLQHSSTTDGENVFYRSSSSGLTVAGKDAVDSWYSEVKDYDLGTPGYQSGAGHFTQLVWKSSTELGVGMATDGKKAYVVGQYRPAGNINTPQYFKDNVFPKE